MMAITTSGLASLPLELFDIVLEYLVPADQVCLFLTCKWAQYDNRLDLQDIFGPSPDAQEDFGYDLQPTWDSYLFARDCLSTGRLDLLQRLQPQLGAIGSFLCANCRRIHVGQPLTIGLDEAESSSSHDFWRIYQQRGLCRTSGSSHWERRTIEIEGSALTFPIARKIDFQAKIKDCEMTCHRVSRVILPHSAAAHFSESSAPVILTFKSCPFVICAHFALRYMNTSDVPYPDFSTTIFADENSTVTHLDTSRGWVPPFDRNIPGGPAVIPAYGGRCDRYFKCRICRCIYGLVVRSQGEFGVEIIMDSFYNYTTQRDMKKCWDPRWFNSEPKPNYMIAREVWHLWGAHLASDWFYPTPALVPGSSGLTEDAFDAVARALTGE